MQPQGPAAADGGHERSSTAHGVSPANGADGHDRMGSTEDAISPEHCCQLRSPPALPP